MTLFIRYIYYRRSSYANRSSSSAAMSRVALNVHSVDAGSAHISMLGGSSRASLR